LDIHDRLGSNISNSVSEDKKNAELFDDLKQQIIGIYNKVFISKRVDFKVKSPLPLLGVTASTEIRRAHRKTAQDTIQI